MLHLISTKLCHFSIGAHKWNNCSIVIALQFYLFWVFHKKTQQKVVITSLIWYFLKKIVIRSQYHSWFGTNIKLRSFLCGVLTSLHQCQLSRNYNYVGFWLQHAQPCETLLTCHSSLPPRAPTHKLMVTYKLLPAIHTRSVWVAPAAAGYVTDQLEGCSACSAFTMMQGR